MREEGEACQAECGRICQCKDTLAGAAYAKDAEASAGNAPLSGGEPLTGAREKDVLGGQRGGKANGAAACLARNSGANALRHDQWNALPMKTAIGAEVMIKRQDRAFWRAFAHSDKAGIRK